VAGVKKVASESTKYVCVEQQRKTAAAGNGIKSTFVREIEASVSLSGTK